MVCRFRDKREPADGAGPVGLEPWHDAVWVEDVFAGNADHLVADVEVVHTHRAIFVLALLWYVSFATQDGSPSVFSSNLIRGKPSMTTSGAGRGPCGPAAAMRRSSTSLNPSDR